MAWRTIVLEGNDVLRKKSKFVTDFGKKTADLMDDLGDTLKKIQGAGLAAPQVGILRRAVVIMREGELVELINPKILESSEEQVGLFEGCLSCPDKRGWLMRPKTVKVRAQNRDGKWFELECTDIAARAALHETEHLDGILFIDKVDRVYTEDEVDELLEQMDEQAERAKELDKKA